MRRCVLTGATGLLGSQLVPLLRPDWQVHGVSRHRPVGVVPSGVIWHPLDLSRELDSTQLPPRADAVIYLAQSEHFREFPARALEIFEVNTANALHFLDYARKSGVQSFIYASSGGVYGGGDAGMSEEIAIPVRGDLGFYLSTKLCSEIAVQNYADHFNVVILRYFFVYGPLQRPNMLIPRLINRVQHGQPIELQGKDGLRINPIHVRDAASATVRALTLGGSHTINIAGPEVLSMREVGLAIGRAVGRDPIFTVHQNASPKHLTGDIAKMRELLVPPQIVFADGVQTML